MEIFLLDKYLDENVVWKIELHVWHWLPLAVWHWWQLSWKFKVMCSGSRSAGSRSPSNHVLVLLIMHCMVFRTQLKKDRSVTVINLLSDELIWTLNNNTFVVVLHKRKTISSLYYTWKKNRKIRLFAVLLNERFSDQTLLNFIFDPRNDSLMKCVSVSMKWNTLYTVNMTAYS